MNNCNTVSRIGVTVVYTPEGVTRKAFDVSASIYFGIRSWVYILHGIPGKGREEKMKNM